MFILEQASCSSSYLIDNNDVYQEAHKDGNPES